MSSWSHVAGVVRVDGCIPLGIDPMDALKEKLGPMEQFDETVDECTLPKGYEGSLVYNIWKNPDENTMASYVVSVFGDLRGATEVWSVVAWVKRTFNKDDFWIRQGCFTMYVEYQQAVNLMWNGEDWLQCSEDDMKLDGNEAKS